MLTATAGASALLERRHNDTLAAPLSTIPERLAGATAAAEEPLPPAVLGKLLPTSYLSRTYRVEDRPIGLFIAYYAQQRGGESMHSPKYCLPGSGWEIWNYGSVGIETGGGTVRINRYSVHNGGKRAVVLYWYQSRKRIIASEYLGKILLVKDSLTDGNTAGSIVKITVADTPAAVAEAMRFAAAVIPHVQHCLGRS
jgi:EpsI family protein